MTIHYDTSMESPAMIRHDADIKAIYDKYSTLFIKFFGVELMRFWDVTTGFDMAEFRKFLSPAKGLSITHVVKLTYGKEANRIFQNILRENSYVSYNWALDVTPWTFFWFLFTIQHFRTKFNRRVNYLIYQATVLIPPLRVPYAKTTLKKLDKRIKKLE